MKIAHAHHVRFVFVFLALYLLANVTPGDAAMRKRLPRVVSHNPKGLWDSGPAGFSQMRVDLRTRVAYISGQVALDANGTLVGAGDLAKQMEAVVHNVRVALRSIGATNDDLIGVTTYIKNYNPDTDLPLYRSHLVSLGRPGSTILSTPSLALDALLIEMEAKAIASPRFVRRQYKKLRGDRK